MDPARESADSHPEHRHVGGPASWNALMTVAALQDLRTALSDLAKRSVGLAKACQNDESVKLYLVLPLLRALGFDSADPLEVYPNHETDLIQGPDGAKVYTADFAILAEGQPLIAVGAARTAADHAAKRQVIATYFSAWPTTKLGLIGDGLLFQAYVDSVEPGVMDTEPFLTLDLETIATAGVPDDVAETLLHATKAHLDPDRIAEFAHLQLVRKRLRAAFVEEAQAPSETLSRAMMARIGFGEVRREVIDRHYASLVKAAFEEALVLPVVQRLKAGGVGDGIASGIKLDVGQGLAGAQHEVALFAALKRRLAFLAETEAEYQAIERIACASFVGRMVVYLERDPDGRLCEIVTSVGGPDKFVFEPPHAAVVTADLAMLDAPLRAALRGAMATLEGARLKKAG